MKYVVLVLVIASFVKCDWVEIPQEGVSLDQGTKNLDFTSYILTTTSTTVQTPILPKPTANKKVNTPNRVQTVSVRNNNDTVVHVSTVSSIVPSSNNKTNVDNSNINSSNIAVNNTNYKKENDSAETNNGNYDENYDSKEPDVKQKEEGEYGFSYANFIPYMSSVQSVLIKSAHKNKKSKVNVLTNLRDHLLSEIDHRMTTLWNPLAKNREAREYKDDSHIEFPSNEGALLTIGFLTFGVFLIKLVLHLIQAINNKIVNNDNGISTTTLIGRKRRSAVDEEAIKILNYMEQYRFK